MLEEVNFWVSWCFIFEMFVKLIGLGLKGYMADRFNIFDFVIVLFSAVEMILQMAMTDAGNFSTGGAISAFRAVRLLRIFKLARNWKSFHNMLVKIGRTFKDISNFVVLLFLFMFTYAMFGMELYAYRVQFTIDNELPSANYEGTVESPRANFDTMGSAIITIIIVIIGDVRLPCSNKV